MQPALSFNDVSLTYSDGFTFKKIAVQKGIQQKAAAQNQKTFAPEDGVCAVKNLNLEIMQGESVAIIGPSGCGKSSTLQMAAGLIFPTSGKVKVQGIRVTEPCKDVSLILQDFGLLPWKNVYANVELGLKLRKMPVQERREKTMKALKAVGLQDVAQSYLGALSGGMKQRLALARSLALGAKLLLMDEPLSALDALLREQMQDLLLELWKEQNYTQVLVTHSIEEALFLGQRIFVMSASPGKIMHVLENPQVGTDGWRENPLFFERVQTLRRFLGTGASGVARAALEKTAPEEAEGTGGKDAAYA